MRSSVMRASQSSVLKANDAVPALLAGVGKELVLGCCEACDILADEGGVTAWAEAVESEAVEACEWVGVVEDIYGGEVGVSGC